MTSTTRARLKELRDKCNGIATELWDLHDIENKRYGGLSEQYKASLEGQRDLTDLSDIAWIADVLEDLNWRFLDLYE